MSSARLCSTLLTVCALAALAPAARPQRPVDPPPSVPADSVAWLPQGAAELTQQATSHTDFTFDRNTLGLVSNLPMLDAPTRQVVARLNAIAVHLYRFAAPAAYSPAALDNIRAQYSAQGWQHLVAKGGPAANGGFDSSEPHARTDVWLETKGINFGGATVLLAGPTSIELIAVSGDISTVDLLRLRGHFGIPNFPDAGLAH